MAIATTLGNATGSSLAYAKHGVLMTGIGGVDAVQNYVAAVKESYALKDAELAARREEFKQAAIDNASVKVYPKRVAKAKA